MKIIYIWSVIESHVRGSAKTGVNLAIVNNLLNNELSTYHELEAGYCA